MINNQTILRYLRSCYPNDGIQSIDSFINFIIVKQKYIGITAISVDKNYENYEIRVKDIEDYISKQRDQLINIILNDE